MSRPSRGPWTAEQTYAVILDAACASLCARAQAGEPGVDVADVLLRANSLWTDRYGLHEGPSRVITRGAVTSQWRTTRELEHQALVHWFDKDLVRVPEVSFLGRDVLNAAASSDARDRRKAVRTAFKCFVNDSVLGDSDMAQWTLRFLVLSKRDSSPFRHRLEQASAQRRRSLLPVYTLAVRVAGWRIPAKDLLDMHLLLVDGALLQLSATRNRNDLKTARRAGEAAALMCRGARKIKPKDDLWLHQLHRREVAAGAPWTSTVIADDLKAFQ